MAESVGNPSSSSPQRSPVLLSHCIEELVKFVLQSAVNGTLGLDIGLSKAYCLALLSEDPSSSPPDLVDSFHVGVSDVTQGAQEYPLYKQLASTLDQCITSKAYQCEEVPLDCESASLEDSKDKGNKFILDKGSELTSMLKGINFELHVQEPFFSQLKDGLKTIEGRCAVGDYRRIESGTLLLINKCLVLEVQDVHYYASFAEMLEAESLEKVLPGVVTVQEGVNIYRRFYTEEKERSNGVLALCIGRPAYQPYIVLAGIISSLSSKGIQSLLGRTNTAGMIS
ncbi:hypothetical protein Dimus_034566 [Dionaea muscipula]